jgi:hypothetical protein
VKVWTATIRIPAETRGYGEDKRTLPALEAKVELSIDLDKLIQHFGEKAARSKGSSTRMLGGKMKLKVLTKREIGA